MQKFCVICGAKLGLNNRFCPECGKPVAIDAPENIDPEITPAPAVSPAVAPSRNKWIKVTIAAIAALLLLGGLGVGGYFILDHFSNKQTQKEETKSFSMTEQQENDPFYQEALELLKTADLSKPTLEIARAAALTANIEILETIQKNGFRQWDDPGIILSAAKYGSVALIKKLGNYGADIYAKNEYGVTVLHHAAWGGNLEVIKYLVNNGANINAKDNSFGWTVLHTAALGGNLEVVKYLVDKGADINAKGKYGATMLHAAAWGGNMELFKYLENKGLDIYAKANEGITVLHLAASGGNLELFKYLENKGLDIYAKADNGDTMLHLAALVLLHGNLKVVKYLVDKGADINAKDNDGETVLHKAAERGNLEVVKYLVDKGADINAKNKYGETALDDARNDEVKNYLISQGAKYGIR